MVEIKIKIEYSEKDKCFVAQFHNTSILAHGDTEIEAFDEILWVIDAIETDVLAQILEASKTK